MTPSEAKAILSIHRPHVDDGRDPLLNEALALAESDADLKRWHEQQTAIHSLVRTQLRSLPVPSHLKAQILKHPPLLRPIFRRALVPWLAAAAVLIAFGLVMWVRQPDAADTFDNYRERVVRGVIRQYTMDIVSAELPEIQTYLATNSAPHEFVLPAGLQQVTLTGAGLNRWRNHPVSMVCFQRPNKEMLFLFVLDRAAVEDPPPNQPVYRQIHKLYTASWTEGNHAYVLAGTRETGFEQKYLTPP